MGNFLEKLRYHFSSQKRYEDKKEREIKALQPILLRNRLKNPFKRFLYKISDEYRRSTNLDIWALARHVVEHYQVSMADFTPSQRRSFREERRKDQKMLFAINRREREQIIKTGQWLREE